MSFMAVRKNIEYKNSSLMDKDKLTEHNRLLSTTVIH